MRSHEKTVTTFEESWNQIFNDKNVSSVKPQSLRSICVYCAICSPAAPHPVHQILVSRQLPPFFAVVICSALPSEMDHAFPTPNRWLHCTLCCAATTTAASADFCSHNPIPCLRTTIRSDRHWNTPAIVSLPERTKTVTKHAVPLISCMTCHHQYHVIQLPAIQPAVHSNRQRSSRQHTQLVASDWTIVRENSPDRPCRIERAAFRIPVVRATSVPLSADPVRLSSWPDFGRSASRCADQFRRFSYRRAICYTPDRCFEPSTNRLWLVCRCGLD